MPRTKSPEKMVLISIHLPKRLLDDIEDLVRRGVFPSRSELIRAAVNEFLLKYRGVPTIEPPKEEQKEESPMELLKGR